MKRTVRARGRHRNLAFHPMQAILVRNLCVVLLAPLLVMAGCGPAPEPESPGGAVGARIVTEDIGRFWEAYDAAAEGANLEASLQELYFDRGTPGLQDFVELRIESAAQLAVTIETMPGYYASIRPNTLRVAEMEPEIRDALLALEKLYPEAAFPDVYFVIGRLTSGGTTSPRGLLIGTEMYGLTDDAPMGELDAWLRSVLKPIDRVPHIVAHELVHFQQSPLGGETLMESCYREGSADFIAELISGDHINGHVHEWALPREAELWDEFQGRMHDEETDGWLYGGQPDGRPADLGYFIGYRIAQAYYEKSPDKLAAVAEILRATDINLFLAASGMTRGDLLVRFVNYIGPKGPPAQVSICVSILLGKGKGQRIE